MWQDIKTRLLESKQAIHCGFIPATSFGKFIYSSQKINKIGAHIFICQLYWTFTINLKTPLLCQDPGLRTDMRRHQYNFLLFYPYDFLISLLYTLNKTPYWYTHLEKAFHILEYIYTTVTEIVLLRYSGIGTFRNLFGKTSFSSFLNFPFYF